MTLPRLPRYPGYDVLAKRDTPSWDDVTREVIDERLATPADPHFCDAVQWNALVALCACIVPQSARNDVPLAALVDAKLAKGGGDGYRDARLPSMRDALKTGFAALDAESRARHELPFASIDDEAKHTLLDDMQHGRLRHEAWHGMSAELFFKERVLHDICGAYYSHPHAWSEIGFGGPANPRGYVRMVADRRDPWEAAEGQPGDEARATKENRRVR